MIYNNTKIITLRESINLIATGVSEKVMVFTASYNENSDNLIINEIASADLGMPTNGLDSRIILITYSTKEHSPRMKISKYKCSNTNDHRQTISLYMDNEAKQIVLVEGNPKNIGMDNKELSMYIELFKQNYNIIRLAWKGYDGETCNAAFIKDVNARLKGWTIYRDRDGILTVYTDASMTRIHHKENMEGRTI